MAMSKEAVAATIGGVCLVLAAIIGVSYQFSDTKKNNVELNNKLQGVKEALRLKTNGHESCTVEKTDLRSRLEMITTTTREYEQRLNILISTIHALNETTLVVNYSSDKSWSGFEHMHGKGEHSLQCAVDRFFVAWNDQVNNMVAAGVKGVQTKSEGVHHKKDCP